MIKRTYGNEYGFQTRAVHTGNDVDSETGAIKRPITMANRQNEEFSPLILTLSEVTKLKKEVNDRFSVQIHFHDGCGGQYFSLDQSNDELKKFIIAYFTNINMQAVFSEDGLYFTIKKGTKC